MIASIVLAVICVFYVYPIFAIFINSLKMNKAITTSGVFQLPTAENFVGLANYVEGVTSMNFLRSFWYSLVISVMSVVLIMVCCSMAAWYIIRVNGPLSKAFYFLCIFWMLFGIFSMHELINLGLEGKLNFNLNNRYDRERNNINNIDNKSEDYREVNHLINNKQ